MKFHSPHRAGLLLAATGMIGASLVAVAAPASAAPAAQQDTAGLATKLAKQLGSRSAGAYLDGASNKLVVTVTSQADAAAVRAAGAVPKTVARSGAQLDQVTAALGRTAKVPGTAWAVDTARNQVLLSVDSSVTGARLAKVRAAAKRLGSAVRTEYVAGVFRPTISGGDAIYGGGFRCSLGFNVTDSAGRFYFLTAGHCANLAANWYSNSARTNLIGTRRGTSFPGNDYAIITYAAGVAHPGTVAGQDITGSANAFVNQAVTRRGSTTGIRTGRVTALNQTVNYAEGSVFGMIRTTVCAEGGDSGGSLYAGSTALGLTSGGSGNCSSGGTTFFQPVTEPLGVYGVRVY